MDIRAEFVRENRNREFYAIYADQVILCTHVWEKAIADLLVAAVKFHYSANPEAWKEIGE